MSLQRHRSRDTAVSMLVQWIEANCRPNSDATSAVRPLIDAVQVGLGSQLLRDLPRARAYHARSGNLEADELLMAGAVINLIRHATGMGDEPGQPVEREVNHTGLSKRLRGGT